MSTSPEQHPSKIALHILSEWIASQGGIRYSSASMVVLESRVDALCRDHGFQGAEDLLYRLQSGTHPDLRSEMLDVASTNHTAFFREQAAFDELQTRIFPYWKNRQKVRIWSAAASTGEEAFSLAMLLVDSFGPSALSRFSILGTDISDKSLQSAEQATYSKTWSPLPAKWMKHTHPKGEDSFVISDSIRRMCIFRKMNLLSNSWPFGKKFDLIFCRNVLYYFNESDQQKIVNQMYVMSSSDARLVTSYTENVRKLGSLWASETPAFFAKKGPE